MDVPLAASFDLAASAIAVSAFVAVSLLRVGMIKVLVASAVAGLALGSAGLV